MRKMVGASRLKLVLAAATMLAGAATVAKAETAAPAQDTGAQSTPSGQTPPSLSPQTSPVSSPRPEDTAPPPGPPNPPNVPNSTQPASTAPGAQNTGATVSEVVVTGYRRSLTDAATNKRRSVNFTDSIYAEDIGKFPDLNIAEALNRVPGVQLTRDITGEGVQISVRGLGPSFTKILLNGAQIAVASDGATDAGNSNREVDLDMFPTELFTKLVVNKTPEAHLLEGGIAGTVDMVNARPFDDPGAHASVSVQGGYRQSGKSWSPRGALILSKTWGDTFGLLFGVAGADLHYRTDGFESIGWTTPSLKNCSGCYTGGGGFVFPSTVPPNTGFGLTPGAPLDPTATSGLPAPTLRATLVPRLPRLSYSDGTRDRVSVLLSGEYRPMENLHFSLDTLWGHAERDFNRLDMDMQVRASNYMVPINWTVDQNDVLTHGIFGNAQFFLEARPYQETVDFYNINPNMEWKLNEWINVDGQIDYNLSTFKRISPSLLIQTPLNSGLSVAYNIAPGSDFPTITPSENLNDPNLGWQWNAIRVQNTKRRTMDLGTHWNATFGDNGNNIKVGVAYDDTKRVIAAYDNSAAANTFGQAAVPNAQLGTYLLPGPSDLLSLSSTNPGYSAFIQPNYGTLNPAINLERFITTAPYSTSGSTGTPSGTIQEANLGGYAEVNGDRDVYGYRVRFNGGLRYVHTDQTITGPVSANGNISFFTLKHPYGAFLPAANVAVDVTNNLVLRLALSRTMTRPNPNVMLPGTTFSDPSAQTAGQGNPDLKPYFSQNFDFGGEYYTGGPGFIGVDYFHKTVTGFTINHQFQEPFTALGIPFSSLAPVQQVALNNQQGVNTLITVNSQINSSQKLSIDGFEIIYTQPLDFLTKGLGFTANFTRVNIHPATLAPNVAPYTYNLTGYYENHDISIHVTYTFLDRRITANPPQNNVNVPLWGDTQGQVDMSASYTLPWFNKAFQLTFNGINLNNERLRTYFGYPNAAFSVYYPGPQYLFGVRARF